MRACRPCPPQMVSLHSPYAGLISWGAKEYVIGCLPHSIAEYHNWCLNLFVCLLIWKSPIGYNLSFTFSTENGIYRSVTADIKCICIINALHDPSLHMNILF